MILRKKILVSVFLILINTSFGDDSDKSQKIEEKKCRDTKVDQLFHEYLQQHDRLKRHDPLYLQQLTTPDPEQNEKETLTDGDKANLKDEDEDQITSKTTEIVNLGTKEEVTSVTKEGIFSGAQIDAPFNYKYEVTLRPKEDL